MAALMLVLQLLLPVSLLLLLPGSGEAITQATVNHIMIELKKAMDHNRVNEALRLAFHDSAGVDGMDGCIDPTDEANAGLEKVVTMYEEIHEQFAAEMSMPDLWALGATWAVNRAIIRHNDRMCDDGDADCILETIDVMEYGREACATSPSISEDAGIPSPTTPRAEYNTFFADGYGLDENQVVALLGVHTLGECNEENSGLDGTFDQAHKYEWTNFPYKALNDPIYEIEYEEETPGHWQGKIMHEDIKHGILLMSDLNMKWEFTLQKDGAGPPDCVAGGANPTCAEASTADMVATYAEDPQAWRNEFEIAYKAMIDRGYDNLTPAEE